MPGMDIMPLAQTAGGTRRGLLRGAGAVAVASALGLRFGVAARAQQTFSTRAQVLHAAPGLGKVEVLFNWEEKLDEFDYGQYSDWLDIDPGVVRVTIRRDRFGINYAVFDTIYPVPVGNDYRLIISDPLIIPTVIDRSSLPADTSRVRVIHASVDTPAVNVAAAGGETLLEGLGYGGVSEALEMPAGTVDLAFTTESGEEVLTTSGIDLKAGSTYDVILYGRPGSADTPLTTVALSDPVSEGEAMATPAA